MEQVIRPTGLLDPQVEVRPVEGQIDDLMEEIRARAERDERVLVTTLTKKMAEDLTESIWTKRASGCGICTPTSTPSSAWRSSGICGWASLTCWWASTCCGRAWTCRRSLWWRFWTPTRRASSAARPSLIQTIGRAARNAEGLVILYADTVTPSMRAAMDETERRRKIQDAYNKAHGIVPKTIIKDVREILEISKSEDTGHKAKGKPKKLTDAERTAEIAKLEQEMKEASKLLEFEYAAVLRDRIIELRGGK